MPDETEEKSIYIRNRENTILAIISTSLAIIFLLFGYYYMNKYDGEHAEKVLVEEKYKLLEEEYIKLQTIYKGCVEYE